MDVWYAVERFGILTVFYVVLISGWGNEVAQLAEALRYKSEGRGFDSRWCHWNFLLTFLPAALWALG